MRKLRLPKTISNIFNNSTGLGSNNDSCPVYSIKMTNLYLTRKEPFIAQSDLIVGITDKTTPLNSIPEVVSCLHKYKVEVEESKLLWVSSTSLYPMPNNPDQAIIPKGTKYWICDNFSCVIAEKYIKKSGKRFTESKEIFAKDILAQRNSWPFDPAWVDKNNQLTDNSKNSIGVYAGKNPEGKPIIVGLSDCESCWSKDRKSFGKLITTSNEANNDFRRDVQFSEEPDILKTKPSSDWYLPAFGELKSVILQQVFVNAELILAGGDIIGGKYWSYWSITEYDSLNSWNCNWNDGNYWNYYRDYSNGVRWFLGTMKIYYKSVLKYGQIFFFFSFTLKP